ncbi:TonB family protein [Hyphococcus sp.]|uniref:TonB family protein n=1 Tax=Hyphococcus sp. TaxID=2038636 RepID=UPI0035C69E38
MAQDKGAEIIKFSSAAEPPHQPAPESAADPQGQDDAPSLERLGAGAYLRAMRERADLSVDAVSSAIKVKSEHLEAIEWMRLDRLPPLPYVTGFVKAYARFLGLDPDAAAAKFKADAAAAAPAPAPEAPLTDRSEPHGEGARLGWIFAMLAVVLFALWVGYQVIAGGERQAEEARIELRPETDSAARSETPALPRVGQSQTAQPIAPPDRASETSTDSASAEAAPDLSNEDETPAQETVAAPETPEAADVTGRDNTPAAEASAASPGELADRDERAETLSDAPAPAAIETPQRPAPRRVQTAPRPQPVIVEAELTRSMAPDYPNRCTRGADDTESVTIRFDVSAEGRPINARIASSTNDCFESEALRTVARWRFDPRTVNGVAAVDAGKTATVNFIK